MNYIQPYSRVIINCVFLLGCVQLVQGITEKPFVIITASYNNASWCTRNISSTLGQQYENYRVIYIDDASTDRTADIVKRFISEHDLWNKITLQVNSERRGHLYNQYYAIHSCADDEIVVIVDGDDWLAHDQVLAYLNRLYSGGDIWMTYGQFWYWKKERRGISRPIPDEVLENGTIRFYPLWILSHLRTFYAGLFKLISLDDLLYQGQFFPMAVDVATMIPMVEMAQYHTAFIDEILLIYNDANQLSFHVQKKKEQERLHHEIIAKKKRYEPLVALPFNR
ncbi:MAG: glycosyltransferase family A protein [Candidatus Babeliales bacterium]